ncbi:HAMP domain-containing sensor histidine kinase [Brevibacillus choshinensis]|uniref:sensor histidine kinase n=1 Tax=Brevibacillus choshinensis TaxID=54911 RepID=UPI002E225E1F|nr:HAMP domain-containing sensor histidine kinase [Brevibacillus choshinensis]
MKNNQDIFRKTRVHLTFMNSFMLIVFLLFFIMGTISVMSYIVYNEQKLELEALTEQEMEESYTADSPVKMDATTPISNQGIYINYFLKQNGDVVVGDEFNPELRSLIMDKVKGWSPEAIQVKYVTFTYGSHQEKEIHFLIAGKRVIDSGLVKGTLYIGKDVSYLWSMFQWLLAVLLGMLLLFVGIAIGIGQIMTRRAMKPIVHSYQLQLEFLADASHELRTPISILKSGLEVMDMGENHQLSSFSSDLLVDLQKEAKSAAKLVDDLMLLARTDSGAQPLFYETFDFFSLAEQVVRSIQNVTPPSQIQLNLLSDRSLHFYGDQERMKQLLYILLNNAVQYTQPGGKVTLDYFLEEESQATKLCITVTDTGIGMEPEHLDSIFRRFYRVDKNRSRESGGTGIGLAIAKWIVEAHQGDIEVESTPGVGSTFTIYLPLT